MDRGYEERYLGGEAITSLRIVLTPPPCVKGTDDMSLHEALTANSRKKSKYLSHAIATVDLQRKLYVVYAGPRSDGRDLHQAALKALEIGKGRGERDILAGRRLRTHESGFDAQLPCVKGRDEHRTPRLYSDTLQDRRVPGDAS